MKIAGKRTAAQWLSFKRMLVGNPTPARWKYAYEKYYLARIETRYLMPMKSILAQGSYDGAGFSVVALFCTLVEFLESCERGRNFRIPEKRHPLTRYEYGPRKAAKYFKSFFRMRPPFKTLMPPGLVESFYKDVRCGLVHEARTKGAWLIAADSWGGALVRRKGKTRILHRDEILPALSQYLSGYRERLLGRRATQAAFVRKFDHLAKIR
jgi:hypothetical protein